MSIGRRSGTHLGRSLRPTRIYAPGVLDEEDVVRLGTPDSNAYVLFSGKDQPHGDELTFFRVRLVGPDLDASGAVESIAGDHGLREPFADRGDGVLVAEHVRLVDWLRELSLISQPWSGECGWRSLADELHVRATCDALGHVSLVVSLQPRPWEPLWTASVILRFALGDLGGVANDLDTWFRPLSRP
jgi:hypothetical protein